jgi:choline kinase
METIPVILEEVEEITLETYPDFPEVEEVIVDEVVPEEIIVEDSEPDETVVEDTVVDIFDEQELEAILEDVETITESEATTVAQDSEFVASLSTEQAVAVFDAIVVADLSTQEIDAIVEAVQDAPAEVREAFEQEINIFAEGFDEYVPLGSTVPVGTRKTLIAVAAGTAAVASSSRRNK